MKTACLLVLIAFAACVYAEECTLNNDCANTMCSSGFHIICEHKNEVGVTTNGGYCTCAKDDLTCATRDDCLGADLNLACSDRRKHCYDGKCICTRWFTS